MCQEPDTVSTPQVTGVENGTCPILAKYASDGSTYLHLIGPVPLSDAVPLSDGLGCRRVSAEFHRHSV